MNLTEMLVSSEVGYCTLGTDSTVPLSRLLLSVGTRKG